jgi:hypothetical protein
VLQQRVRGHEHEHLRRVGRASSIAHRGRLCGAACAAPAATPAANRVCRLNKRRSSRGVGRVRRHAVHTRCCRADTPRTRAAACRAGPTRCGMPALAVHARRRHRVRQLIARAAALHARRIAWCVADLHSTLCLLRERSQMRLRAGSRRG